MDNTYNKIITIHGIEYTEKELLYIIDKYNKISHIKYIENNDMLLETAFRTNKNANPTCKDQSFWNTKFINDFGVPHIDNVDWKKYYYNIYYNNTELYKIDESTIGITGLYSLNPSEYVFIKELLEKYGPLTNSFRIYKDIFYFIYKNYIDRDDVMKNKKNIIRKINKLK